ncbi:MAG: tyrosine-protein phosphatase [Armatimonadetes bacterium]|nr:tyrosine-protein phosphatase [Armatimonadota bacterium]
MEIRHDNMRPDFSGERATFNEKTAFSDEKDSLVDVARKLSRELSDTDASAQDVLRRIETISLELTPENYSQKKRELRSLAYTREKEITSAMPMKKTPDSTETRTDFHKLMNLVRDSSYKRLMGSMSRMPCRSYVNSPPVGAIPNFDQVSLTMFRGGLPTQEGADWLVANCGIKTVVDLTPERPTGLTLPRWKNAKVYEISVSNYKSPDTGQVEQVLKLLDNPEIGPVYVHCLAGQGRTGLMIGCLRITQGRSAEEAYEELLTYDPHHITPEKEEEHRNDLKNFLQQFETYWRNRPT